MPSPIDSFGIAVHAARRKRGLTQKQLAEMLHMSVRTIMDAELGRSNPRFETVALIAQELDISLDAILFPEVSAPPVSKSLADYFSGKTEMEIQKYVAIRYNKFRKKKNRHGLQNSGRIKLPHNIPKGACKPCLRRLYN